MTRAANAKPTGRRGQRTVRGKLTLLVLTSVALAVSLVAGISAWRDAGRDAARQSERFLATAGVMASLSEKAAVERDPADAFRILRSISLMPGVAYARIELRDGRLLAEVGSGERLSSDLVLTGGAGHDLALIHQLASRTTQVTSPILHDGAPVGRLVLLGRTPGVLPEILASLGASALAAATAIVLGLLIAWRMQRSITDPISALAASMAAVREDHDYDRRLRVQTSDEVGQLIDGFNAMLSEIRRRDKRIADQVAGLETEVALRTVDYKTARDAAELANAAKSDFLATMSHEIRTPLNGIMVMAEMLAVGEMPPRQRRFADVIVNSGSSLLAIINDILDFSKIEAGKMDLEAIPVDVCEVIEDVCSLFWERAASKGVDLACFIDPSIPKRISADPVRLRQVIGNLVNNAIKFTDQGGVLVEARLCGQDSLRVYVRDTGVGIPADKIGSVFGAFNQADQTTTRRFGGTGLGLSISKRLVEAMGGRFSVSSVLGRGSTFAFEFPTVTLEPAEPWPLIAPAQAEMIVDVAGQSTRHALSGYLKVARPSQTPVHTTGAQIVRFTDGQDLVAPQGDMVSTVRLVAYGDARPVLDRQGAAQAVLMRPPRRRDILCLLSQIQNGEAPTDPMDLDVGASPAAALPAFPGARVLVADDSAVNREVALAALGRLGITPELANDGRVAVAAATRQPGGFDLILMDGSMPELDGYDACREIRAFESSLGLRATPIIALTAHVVGSGADAWRTAGMDDVLHKPFTLHSLAAILAKHLQPAAPIDAAAAAAPRPPSADHGREDDLLDSAIYAQIVELAAGGGSDFALKIQTLYRTNAPVCISDLRDAAQAKDNKGVADAAHALKSMSFNIGAKRVSILAETIEQDARDGKCPSPLIINEIAAALDTTVEHFGLLISA